MVENEDLEQNQNVTEYVNVPEAENQPQNVNVAENVAETDNLAVFWAMEAIPSMWRKLGNRFANHGCPRFKNWEFIRRGSTMSQTWLEKEADGTLTGLAELWPTRREEKEDYWRGIDDDISNGPQFVPLKGFVGKEDRAEPSTKQLHKNKRKQYHGPDDPIKRRRNFFNASPRMRTTQHVRDRPDLSPPPLDETHSPLRHPSSGGTQNGLLSSDDNHRTSSPTRQRQPQPPPPPVDRRQQSKRSEGRSRGENHAEQVSNPYLPSDPFEAATQGLDAAHTEGSTHTETTLADPTHTETSLISLTHTETAPTDPTHTETPLVSLTHTKICLRSLAQTESPPTSPAQTETPTTSPADPTHTKTPPEAPTDPKTAPADPTHTETAPTDPTHTETPLVSLTHTNTCLGSLAQTESPPTSPAQTETPTTSPVDPTQTKIPQEAPTDPKTAPATLTHPEIAPQTASVDPKTAPADPTDTEIPFVSLTHTEKAPAIPAHTRRPPEAPANPTQNETATASPAHTETDDIHTYLPPSHDVHTPPPPSKRTQHEPDVSESGLPDESTSNRGNPRAGLPPSDPTEIARERWVSKWLRSPYTDPSRPMKEMEVNIKYNAFMNDPNLLFRYIGIDASVSQSFFKELEDPMEWLGIEHEDAYINLLCKRKNDPMEKKQFKRKVAVVDCAFFNELTLIWRQFQPDFHAPLTKVFYPGKFNVPLDLIEYAIGNKPAWGTAWASVDDVRRMKFVIEAIRKEALRQEATGIAHPEGDSDESSPEDPPKEEHNEGIPKYTPQETRGAGEEADLAGDLQNTSEPPVDEAATQTDSLARSRLKGKEKVGEPSEPVALSHWTSSSCSVVNEPDNVPRDAETATEPLGAVAPKILVPLESVPVPSSTGGGAELRHPDPDFEDPAADLNTHGRFACSEWGIGMEIDNDVKREEVEKLVRELMERKKGEKMRSKAMELKNKAKEATTSSHGSSYLNFNKLVDEVLLP
ncbi:hypothetical protein LWI29_004769 [Acer saccharum]|uniref:Uncharacterized protein n=1 Tax=Acer saccharum TaxID=4024 RepID=A0AA39RPC2_ACESA|nr:hypothetical protein LWI29_004769 [Acer saccharum]